MRHYATKFYERAIRYYPSKESVNDALEIIRNGSVLFEVVKKWYENNT